MSNNRPRPPGSPWGNVSGSTLFPLPRNRAKLSELARKTHLVPMAATLAATIGLFLAMGQVRIFVWIIGLYITFAFLYFIYQLCGRTKPWWVLAGVGLATMAALGFGDKSFGMGLYAPISAIFDVLGKGLMGSDNPMLALWGAFCVGLSEELFKALPVLLLALVALTWRDARAALVGVTEPLDGILVGVASAAGFTLIETLNVYVPHVMNARGGGVATGLMLLMPRMLGELGGHMAYSGFFGYFIGLSVLRPRSAVPILLVGWVLSAGLHGAWDGVASVLPDGLISGMALFGVAVLSYACLATAILKARQISPSRSQNFATRFSSRPLPVANPPAPPPPLQVGASIREAERAAPRPAGRGLTLTIGSVRHAVTPGTQLGPQALGSAGAGRGKGPIAEFTTNPSDANILGLRNLSTAPWRVVQPGGNTLLVDAGRTVRLDPGLTIDFGGVQGRVQSAG